MKHDYSHIKNKKDFQKIDKYLKESLNYEKEISRVSQLENSYVFFNVLSLNVYNL